MNKMLDNSESLFEDVSNMLRKLKKASYEENMKKYRQDNESNLKEMLDYVASKEDKATASKEVGEAVVRLVENKFAKNNGKLPSRLGADLDFYSIYYLFPAILLSDDENAELLVENIKDCWNKSFRKNIGYTTYEKLRDSFRNKIFGIF